MLWGFLQTYEMSLPSSKKSKGIAMKVSLNEKIEVEHINTTEKEKFVLPLKNKLKKIRIHKKLSRKQVLTK